jgi:hypothetical protein
MSPRVYPTGVTIHDPFKAWHGFVLFGAPDRRTHIVDPSGAHVHSWP